MVEMRLYLTPDPSGSSGSKATRAEAKEMACVREDLNSFTLGNVIRNRYGHSQPDI